MNYFSMETVLFSSLISWIDALGLFLFLAGFVLGLGAVTVIDLHGFLARHSAYWTEATIRSHKITKPLIWGGIILAVIGGCIFYRQEAFVGIPRIHAFLAGLLVVNGCFLSFSVSPFLLRREQEGRSAELLPSQWQHRIILSFVISDVGWWGALGLLVVYLLQR